MDTLAAHPLEAALRGGAHGAQRPALVPGAHRGEAWRAVPTGVDAGDLRHLATAVAEPLAVDDDVDRRGDPRLQGRSPTAGSAIATIAASRVIASAAPLAWRVVIDPAWPVFIAVSMSTASVSADLADDEPVRPHPQRVADEVAEGDLAPPLGGGRTALLADEVGMDGGELGDVLEDENPLLRGHELAERCEERGLAGPGPAGDQQVAAAQDGGVEEGGGRGVEGAELIELGDAEAASWRPADGEQRRPRGDRREHRVDPAAVGEAGVDHRRALVDPPPAAAEQPVDDGVDVTGVAEADRAPLQPAVHLDVDVVGPVHHDLGHRGIGEDSLQRPQTGEVVDRLEEPGGVLRGVERRTERTVGGRGDAQATLQRWQTGEPGHLGGDPAAELLDPHLRGRRRIPAAAAQRPPREAPSTTTDLCIHAADHTQMSGGRQPLPDHGGLRRRPETPNPPNPTPVGSFRSLVHTSQWTRKGQRC